jgi:hypothetical protein
MTDAPNDPDRLDPDQLLSRDRDGVSTVGLAGVFIVSALVVGVVLYAVNRGDGPVVTAGSPPAATSAAPATTGQSQQGSEPATPAPEATGPAPESKEGPKEQPKAK